MTGGDPLSALCEELRSLRRAVGSPTYRMIENHAGRNSVQISHSGVGNLLNGRTTPRRETVIAFVVACRSYARGKSARLPDTLFDLKRWHELVDSLQDEPRQPVQPPPPAFDETFLPAVTWKRITELMNALPGPIAADQLVRLLWEAVDDIGPLTVAESYELLPLLRALDTRFVPRGSMPPVLALLEYIAATQHVALGRHFHRLIDELVAAHGVLRDEAAHVRERASAQRADAGAISVFVKVDPVGEPGYRLTAWLYRPGSIVTFKREAVDRCGEPQLRPMVERLIGEIGPLVRGVDLRQLTFEFVLPWNLLGTMVEGWHLDDGRSIGTRSPVVVRSLERMQDPWAAAEWRRRSDLLYHSSPNDDLVTSGTIRQGPHSLGKGAAYIAADGPYVAPASWRDDHPLLTALKDGLPVALWHHKGGDPQWLVDLIRTTVVDADLHRLPSEVLRLRSVDTAVSVCLLWDDYHRQPESVDSLTRPVMQGDDR